MSIEIKHDDLCVIQNIYGEGELWRALYQAEEGRWWFKPFERHGDKKKFHITQVKRNEGPRPLKGVL